MAVDEQLREAKQRLEQLEKQVSNQQTEGISPPKGRNGAAEHARAPETKKGASQKTIFTEPDTGNTITFVSETECEVKTDFKTYLAEHSREGDKLRIVIRAAGEASVVYFDVLPAGFRDSQSGTVYVRPEVLENGNLTRCLSSAKQIGLACRAYALDHDNNYPQQIDDLFPRYLQDSKILRSPLSPNRDEIGYEYFGAGVNELKVDRDKPLIRGRYKTTDGRRSLVRFTYAASIETE